MYVTARDSHKPVTGTLDCRKPAIGKYLHCAARNGCARYVVRLGGRYGLQLAVLCRNGRIRSVVRIARCSLRVLVCGDAIYVRCSVRYTNG
jgi:hypothetical protein